MRGKRGPAPSPITKTVNIDTIAQRLDVSPWTIRTWIRQGKLRCIKIGRRVLVPEQDVEALLRRHSTLTPPTRNGTRERPS